MAIGSEISRSGAAWQPFAQATAAPARLRALREADDDAQAILAFHRSGIATHAIDPAQAMWVIDLAPGDGERAWRVLRLLSGLAPRGAPIRYLACCPAPPHRARLAAHPSLRAAIADGSLFLDRAGLGIPLHAPGNPVVVLAHDALSALPQGLYAVHCGELLQAWSDGASAIDWRAVARRDGLMHLLAAYRQALDSVAFSMPLGAMQTLGRLLRASGGRLLLRASDHGAKDMTQLRMGALSHTPGQPLRVNFEVLARWHRAYGASVHQTQRDDDGRVLHVALHDVAGGRLCECLPDLLGLPHPDDHARLLQVLDRPPALSPAQCLAVLHAHAGDPRALAALSPQLAQAAPALTGAARRQWREMLECCWAQHYPRGDGDHDPMPASIATLALRLAHWPLARKLLRAMLRVSPRDAASWRLLAQAQIRTGGARAAAISLDLAHAACPDDAQVSQARDALAARMSAWRQRPGYRAALARDRQLVLEPLDVEHAPDMHRQYRDPQIATMARLPAFDTVESLRRWIAARMSQTRRIDLAVMHAERGFVGAVGSRWFGASAFIHFWIGVDHQGAGLSARAVRLLLAQLNALGVRHVFAAVYPDNHRSLRTLRRLGFLHLPLRAMAPDQTLRFLAWTHDDRVSAEALCEVVREYARAGQSAYVFAEPGPDAARHAPAAGDSGSAETRSGNGASLLPDSLLEPSHTPPVIDR